MSKSGREFITQAATSLIWHDGDAIGYVFNIIDMTDKARLEHEVNLLTLAKLEAQLEAQRRQTEMSIQVQENEKESIARELHDGVGQLLSLAKLQLEEISSKLSPELQQQGKNLRELVQHITTDIKGLTRDLMPLSVRNLGLEGALSGLLERYHSLKEIEITCKIHLEGYDPDQRNAVHIYRIAQEAINNAIKYSHATSISLMCMKLKSSINLIVEDNGKGFDLSTQLKKQNSFGLKTMQERARLIRGKLLINSADNSGTTISLTIPLS
jgi:signal transduction histidine kinase